MKKKTIQTSNILTENFGYNQLKNSSNPQECE